MIRTSWAVDRGQSALARALSVTAALLVTLGAGAVEHSVEPMKADVTVHTTQRIAPIDPLVYGQQIEFMGNCIDGGLWAELLRNRKFALADENGDGVSDGWVPVGDVKPAEFELDTTAPLAGTQAQSIILPENIEGAGIGIYQDHVPLHYDKGYTGYIYLRASDFEGQVRVGFARGGGPFYIHETIGPLTSEWQQYPFSLTAPLDDSLGSFQIRAVGKGKLSIGGVSLMRAENSTGLVQDVVDLIKAVRPPHMRWPGGCYADYYHFEQAIGPREKRAVTYDPHWQAWSSNDMGTDEFIAFCREVGAEPSITLNFRTGTPEEAANWIEYCNGAVDTPFGRKRAENGHPEPYNVRYWSLGNETWNYFTAEEYAAEAAKYVPVLKKADPTISLCAVGAILPWEVTVAEAVGNDIDMISQHYYFPGFWTVQEGTEKELAQQTVLQSALLQPRLEQVRKALDAMTFADGRGPQLTLDEWNVWVHSKHIGPRQKNPEAWEAGGLMALIVNDFQRNFSLSDGLHACSIFNMLYRLAGEVVAANVFTSCNQAGIIQTDGQVTYPTPVYRAFELYRDHSGSESVPCDVTCGMMDVRGQDTEGEAPLLDIAATASPDGNTLYVHAINRSLTAPIDASIHLDEFAPSRGAAHILSADSWDSRNGPGHPETVRVREEALPSAAQPLVYTLAPHSAVTLEFSR